MTTLKELYFQCCWDIPGTVIPFRRNENCSATQSFLGHPNCCCDWKHIVRIFVDLSSEGVKSRSPVFTLKAPWYLTISSRNQYKKKININNDRQFLFALFSLVGTVVSVSGYVAFYVLASADHLRPLLFNSFHRSLHRIVHF